MPTISQKSGVRLLAAALAISASGSLYAQDRAPDPDIVVNANRSTMAPGPEIKGVISARHGDRIKVTADNGTSTVIAIDQATQIRTGGGLFGSNRSKLGPDALVNGLPVTVKTFQPADGQPGGELLASRVTFRNNDFKVANMIRNGTSQKFDEQTAATEALRGRVGDIDKYNVVGTTNVHFDTGKTELSEQDKAQLCTTASQADRTENALLLVVGYTDAVGSDDFNQTLSEKRAARVINYLQQVCHWKPYRVLTPTGMAKADPLAPNDTPEGKAQNRRVAVNILVSKAVEGL